VAVRSPAGDSVTPGNSECAQCVPAAVLLGGNAETSGSYAVAARRPRPLPSRLEDEPQCGLAWLGGGRPCNIPQCAASNRTTSNQRTLLQCTKHAPCDHKLQPAHSLRWANRRRPRYPNRWTRRRPLARLPV
jgi:hypothetical protein